MSKKFLSLFCMLGALSWSLWAPIYKGNRASGANEFRLDLTHNELGLDPREVVANYNSTSKKVMFNSVDPHYTIPYPPLFLNVYVKKLSSDPVGITLIGTFPNSNLNPGFVHEYTSQVPVFSVYVSKY